MWGSYGMGLWGWAFGGLVLVGVVVLVVVVLVVVLIGVSSNSRRQSALPGPGTRDSGTLSPKQILDDRYARGELTSKEYRERLATLGLKP